MKRIDFPKEFYVHLYDAIMEAAGDVVYDSEKEGYPDTFYVDGYGVDATVYYGWEVHDDSFDHAFGTWHDPYPYMEAESLEDIADMKVYDQDTDEEVEGFDYDAFMEQFEVPTIILWYKDKEKRCTRSARVSEGDKVFYNGKEVTFLAKNQANAMIKIKDADGIRFVSGISLSA